MKQLRKSVATVVAVMALIAALSLRQLVRA